MVRKKVDIVKIEDKSKRQVTFTKRRQGLFKKASALCNISNYEIGIVTFSLAGNMYAWGHPTVDSVLQRYMAYRAQKPDENHQENETSPGDHHQNKREMKKRLLKDLTEKAGQEKGLVLKNNKNNSSNQEGEKRVEGHAAAAKSKVMASWNLPKVDDLEIDELERLMADMEEMKKKVVDRANQMKSSAGRVPSS
nr:agamous-like MADS-box protein AGL62 [Coffea arabica]